jgi:hypothetical protein
VTNSFHLQCCYIPPERPCNLCHTGEKSYSVLDQTVSFNGAVVNCYGIHNYLSTRHEIEDDECVVTKNDLFDDCCYPKCRLCQDYQLDPEMLVTHEGITRGCSEIENHFIGLNEITEGSETCGRIQQEHFDSCCYDVPCNICAIGEVDFELLVYEPVVYMGVNRTCGDWSVLASEELSQGDVCKTSKADLFDSCCFKECSLCTDPGWVINWNKPLTYDGLASTCLDVYMNMRSDMVQDGDDLCQSIQFTVSQECCLKMPKNQCSLCQSNNGTYLNTNWNQEVNYQGEKLTCGDINALLSAEELDSILCISARDDLWNPCCTPQQGGNSLLELGPPLEAEVSDSDSDSGLPGWDSWNSTADDEGNYGLGGYFRRNKAQIHRSSLATLIVFLVEFITSFLII